MNGKWYYIQWHNDAHNRPQVQDVVMELGWEAYGIFVALTEILHKNGGLLPLFSLKSVAWSLHIPDNKLKLFVERFLSVGLMEIDNDNLSSAEVRQQFQKQERATVAANKRWGKAEVQLPQPLNEQPKQAEAELTDAQKQAVALLTDKLRYAQNKAEELARAYDYNYIVEKYKYLMSLISKKHDIRAPHSYFEKALKENWVGSDEIAVRDEKAKAYSLSYNDVAVNKFLADYKSLTKTNFPADRISELKNIIDSEEFSVSLVLEIITKHYEDDVFWRDLNIKKDCLSDCSAFFDRQKAKKIIEYSSSKNIFDGCSLDDIVNMIGGSNG